MITLVLFSQTKQSHFNTSFCLWDVKENANSVTLKELVQNHRKSDFKENVSLRE